MALFFAELLCCFAAIAKASPAPYDWRDNGRPHALTDAGPVIGNTRTVPDANYDLNVYLGVPFAAPPERWLPPVPPTPWEEPYDASTISPACIQQFNYPEARRNLILQWFNTPAAPESEDCLYLNVYAPRTKKPSPVMVWIYGGGNLYGSNFNPLYNGEVLAANEDVVTVMLNYRTNVFGFPGAAELPVAERNLG
jgi:carboxylesterase type B